MGNTLVALATLSLGQDHSHICGEYFKDVAVLAPEKGSPPHLWGILGYLSTFVKQTRITPTPVGNTSLTYSKPFRYKDHPHTCGEYRIMRTFGTLPIGSPPHLWGIPSKKQGYLALDRITPTPVGNTNRKRGVVKLTGDHPHTCGEYTKQVPSDRHFIFANTQVLVSLSISAYPISF